VKIDLYVNRAELENIDLNKNQIAVIIDVLRASTSIITALANGCKAVIPVAEVADAFKKANKLGREKVLIGGERNEQIVAGFDLSNSPSDYGLKKVKDKTIVFTSTNGAQLFDLARSAGQSIVGGFVNISSVAAFSVDKKNDVAILCAGKSKQFGLEDVVCGGMIIKKIMSRTKEPPLMNDGANAAIMLYERYAGDLLAMLYRSSHGQRLIAIGQANDLSLCAALDTAQVVPICQNGKIILADQKGN